MTRPEARAAAAARETLRRTVAERLAQFPRRSLEQLPVETLPVEPHRTGDLRPAAVALTMGEHPRLGEVILLTRRADLSRHAGQYALPGGRLDPGETSEEAARRELQEELGVTSSPENVLGRLDDHATRSGFVITPVVLWMDDWQEPVPDPREVAEVLLVPHRELLDPDLTHLHPGALADRPVLSVAVAGTEVFSPTAAILYQFREVVLHGRPTRVDRFDQPRFAWR